MLRFPKLRRYLTVPRSAARIQRDVDEELRVHLEMRVEELVHSGLSPENARAAALREFGDLEDARSYCATVDRSTERQRRAASGLSELRLDGRHALRMLRRTPTFTAATLLTLALAIGATTAVYTVFEAYLLRALPYPSSDRLVSILEGPRQADNRRGPSLDPVDWTTVDPLFQNTARWDIDGFTILGEPYAENVTGAWVSSGFFSTLDVRPAIGRRFDPDEYRDPAPTAIISHRLWARRFASDSSILGSTVVLHSTKHPRATTRVTIVGVLARDFWPIHWRDSDILRPLPPDPHAMPLLAQLRPGVSIAEAQQRLNAVVRPQIAGAVSETWYIPLVPALARYSERVRPVLGAVFGATLFMFLAACASVAGTLISRLTSRQNELAVRAVLGGSRGRIVRQLLTESAVLATLAGALGVAIAYVLLRAAAPVVEKQLALAVPGGTNTLQLTVSVAVRALIVSAAAGVALGLIAVLASVRTNVRHRSLGFGAPVRDFGRNTAGRRLRRILIAGQLVVAMILLFGAALMVRTVAEMSSTTLGFREKGVLTANLMLPGDRYPDSASKRVGIERVIASVSGTDGVRGAAGVFPRPMQGAWQFPVGVEGSAVDDDDAPRATTFTVTDGYFATMGIKLIAGRGFTSSDDHRATHVVVISQALAERIAPTGGAIGRRIRVRVPLSPSFDDDDKMPWRTVVGVVTDTKKEYSSRPSADVYVPYAQNPRNYLSMVVWTDRPISMVTEPVRRAAASADPTLALSGLISMRDIIASAGGEQRGLGVLLGAFAIFSLVLSALALYASLSYTVMTRRPELALRLAIGAQSRDVLRLVLAEGLATTLVGVAGGTAAALALGRVLRNQVYGVGTADPVTLMTIATLLGVTAIAACAIPAVRASRTDAAQALRET